MKRFRHAIFASFALLGLSAESWGQLAVGSASRDSTFTLFDEGGRLANHSLSQFEGKIVLAFYFTPW